MPGPGVKKICVKSDKKSLTASRVSFAASGETLISGKVSFDNIWNAIVNHGGPRMCCSLVSPGGQLAPVGSPFVGGNYFVIFHQDATRGFDMTFETEEGAKQHSSVKSVQSADGFIYNFPVFLGECLQESVCADKRFGKSWPTGFFDPCRCKECGVLTTRLGARLLEWPSDEICPKHITVDQFHCGRCECLLLDDDQDLRAQDESGLIWCFHCAVKFGSNFTGA